VYPWIITAITFIATAAVALIPVLFLLASTPLHDGSDVPGPALLFATLFLTAIIAAAAAWRVHARLRRLSAKDG
jgi:hypothetical protein